MLGPVGDIPPVGLGQMYNQPAGFIVAGLQLKSLRETGAFIDVQFLTNGRVTPNHREFHMPNKLPKDELQQHASIDRPTPATSQENRPGAPADEISAEQMEDILIRARQAVKPTINRRAANEAVSEEVLNFRMV